MDRNTPTSWLRLTYPVIYERDLTEVMTAFGLILVDSGEDHRTYAIPIEFPWRVVVEARVARRDGEMAFWSVDFRLDRIDVEGRVGGVARTDNATALRRQGASVLQQLFASVDEPERYHCPRCPNGWLVWDGAVPTGNRRALARCTVCDWHDRPGGFEAYRELK